MKAWLLKDFGLDNLVQGEVETPVPQAGELLVKVGAVSLNFRDIAMISGRYPVEVIKQGVPCSDAAATVVAVGSEVTKAKVGDYVTPSFQTNYITGTEKHSTLSALGGDVVDNILHCNLW